MVTLNVIAELARTWRTLDRLYVEQEEPVLRGQLGFAARKETEQQRDETLNALRAAVDEFDNSEQ